MTLKRLFYAAVCAAVFSSCNLFNKLGKSDNNIATVNLDTVEATPKAPEPEEYQASFPHVNDLVHTKLDVSFDWTKQYMYGKATITLKPHFYPTSTVELDARGMEIKEVALMKADEIITTDAKQPSIKGVYGPSTTVTKTTTKIPLQFKYENDIITIQLGKEYKKDQEYTIFIDYVSKPNELKKKGGSAAITDDKGLYFINPDGKEKDKPMEIWTQGETQSSSVWFPTIDHPNQRMTQEIYITTEKKYVTLSNGELCSSFDNGDGTRTDYWKMDLPHAPYLAMMAIGDFAIVKDKWRGKEVNYYVEHEYEPYARDIFGHTPDMLEFFSNKLGVEYAWNKYSQIVARDYVSGAMENTTATLHSEYLQRTDRELLDKDYEDYVSHELFHQWFGDLVTCESWSNLPLNESFATYGEYLWQEHRYGLDAADEHSAESRAGYFNEAEHKQTQLIRFHYTDREDMFDGHSYNKGGQVLHMLRKYVGDDAFFASLKLYLETNKFNSVEIHNLRLAFEKVTGEDLNWFFNEWFLSSGHPELVIATEYDAQNKKEKVRIQQKQDFSKTPLFKMPLFVDVYVNGFPTRKKITITKADETFEFDASVKPDLVNVDAEKMLLCTKDEKKTIKELEFQYYKAPLFLDRYEALEGLAQNAKDSVAAHVIVSALNDKFWTLRLDAINALKDLQPGHEKEIKETLVMLAKRDEKSLVRSAAIDFLASHYTDADLQDLYKNGMNDRAYSVLGSSLGAIAKAKPEEGMALAKQYENEKSVDVLYAVADMYANYGSDDNNDFYVKSESKFTGFNKIGFVTEYAAFLTRVKKDQTVISGAELLAGIAKDPLTNKWVAYYAKKSLKDLATMYDDRIEYNTKKIKTLKDANSTAPTQELEAQIEDARIQRQKIVEIFNTIK